MTDRKLTPEQDAKLVEFLQTNGPKTPSEEPGAKERLMERFPAHPSKEIRVAFRWLAPAAMAAAVTFILWTGSPIKSPSIDNFTLGMALIEDMSMTSETEETDLYASYDDMWSSIAEVANERKNN